MKKQPALGGPAERHQELLRDFQNPDDDMRCLAVADKSGLPVRSSSPVSVNVLSVAASATMVAQSCQRLYQHLGPSGPTDIVVVGPDSAGFMRSTAEGRLFVIVVLERRANLGLAGIKVESLAQELSEILSL